MPDRPSRPGLLADDLGQQAGTEEDLLLGRSHDGVAFTGFDLAGERLHDRDLLECLLADGGLDEAVLTGSRLRRSRVERCSATSVRLDGAQLREVELDSCRLGALTAYDARWRIVHLRGCRIGYANLRGSELVDVTLEDCVVDELDLGAATLARVALPGSRVGHLHVPGATLREVDLRAAELQRVTGIEALRGATISPAQLLELGPLLAEHLGIAVA